MSSIFGQCLILVFIIILVILVQLAAAASVATDTHDVDYDAEIRDRNLPGLKLKITMKRNNGDATLLVDTYVGKYHVGDNITLTCRMEEYVRFNLSWWEKGNKLGSDDFADQFVSQSKVILPALETADDGRELSCKTDGSAITRPIVLNNVDDGIERSEVATHTRGKRSTRTLPTPSVTVRLESSPALGAAAAPIGNSTIMVGICFLVSLMAVIIVLLVVFFKVTLCPSDKKKITKEVDNLEYHTYDYPVLTDSIRNLLLEQQKCNGKMV